MGRDRKFGEKSEHISVRVPSSKKAEYRKAINKFVEEKFFEDLRKSSMKLTTQSSDSSEASKSSDSSESSPPQKIGHSVDSGQFADILNFFRDLPDEESDDDE